ncbi:transmembrane protein 154 isoform 2-T2 [Fundulus diaphanus]
MSALDNMRGPRLETPLLFLLLLLSSLTGTAHSEDGGTDSQTTDRTDTDDGNDKSAETVEAEFMSISLVPPANPNPPGTDEEGSGSGSPELPPPGERDSKEGGGDNNLTSEESPADQAEVFTILIPVVLAVVIIGAIVCIVVIMRRCKDKSRNQAPSKEDPELEGFSTEKVPMPMFEDDVPSVLELEMEELDKWMMTHPSAF